MNFARLAGRAKKVIDQRGGTGALKQDAAELAEIAKGKGTPKEKAKRAADALKQPGAAATPPAATPVSTPVTPPAPPATPPTAG